jgi:hypothetical protein
MRNENATVEAKAVQVLANNRTSLITVRQKLAAARQAQAAVGDELSPTYGTVGVGVLRPTPRERAWTSDTLCRRAWRPGGRPYTARCLLRTCNAAPHAPGCLSVH